jgi:hypothetical protein
MAEYALLAQADWIARLRPFLDRSSPGGLAAAGRFFVLRTTTEGVIVHDLSGLAPYRLGPAVPRRIRPPAPNMNSNSCSMIRSEARAEASGMMVAVIVLMLVGEALSAIIWRLQVLRWQGHNMAE